ncbi:hypothetical protein FSP39_007643 [Pinctada imbricata]|uniref:Nuclear receptor domain-containing protein n=1 Tax=Pinctada imbricata TaxID=66713 RepID=A0AA89BYP6_PINIB|nr:hypothetical protein FSP39_007643 [Pinctada imbricata]
MIQHAEKADSDDCPPITERPGSEQANSSNHEDIQEASGSNTDMQFPPDVKYCFEEVCPVCGDKVSGYHYGLLTCESCKGFFKRTVQNKKVYSCVDNRSCMIDKSQRKRCPYCRFQKCLSVGMKLEAVRQDRMRGGRNKFGPMYKRDRALKQQALRQQQQLLATCQMRLGNGMNMLQNGDQDIKPDPALLQQIVSEGGLGYAMNPSPMSSLPSPTMPDSPPADLSRAPSSQSSPTTPINSQVQFSMPPGFHHQQPSVMSAAMRNHYSPSPSNNHFNHFHQMPSFHPPIVPIVPHLITDMKLSMTDEAEIKQKLVSFLLSEYGHEDFSSEPSRLIHMICKLSDQLLFLMVEWARTSLFFKELKVEDQMKLLQNCKWSKFRSGLSRQIILEICKDIALFITGKWSEFRSGLSRQIILEICKDIALFITGKWSKFRSGLSRQIILEICKDIALFITGKWSDFRSGLSRQIILEICKDVALFITGKWSEFRSGLSRQIILEICKDIALFITGKWSKFRSGLSRQIILEICKDIALFITGKWSEFRSGLSRQIILEICKDIALFITGKWSKFRSGLSRQIILEICKDVALFITGKWSEFRSGLSRQIILEICKDVALFITGKWSKFRSGLSRQIILEICKDVALFITGKWSEFRSGLSRQIILEICKDIALFITGKWSKFRSGLSRQIILEICKDVALFITGKWSEFRSGLSRQIILEICKDVALFITGKWSEFRSGLSRQIRTV